MPERRGDCVALYAFGKRQGAARLGAIHKAVVPLPILLEHVAMTQIRDTCASHLSQERERRGVWCLLQEHVDTVASTLEWYAVMRCTEKHDFAQLTGPCVIGR